MATGTSRRHFWPGALGERGRVGVEPIGSLFRVLQRQWSVFINYGKIAHLPPSTAANYARGHQVALCYPWDIDLKECRSVLGKKAALLSTQVVVVEHHGCMWHEGSWGHAGGLCEAESHHCCSHVPAACRNGPWSNPSPGLSQI